MTTTVPYTHSYSTQTAAASSAPLPLLPINPSVPLRLLPKLSFLGDDAFKNGVHLVGGPGAGKSRLLGRLLAWQWLVRSKPQLILDPTGSVTDNLLDRLNRFGPIFEEHWWQQYQQPLPPAWVRYVHDVRRQLLARLRYVDVGATDYLVPTPLYYAVGEQDTLFARANRLLALIKRQDPQLESAPILGWNSLYECGIHAGMIAAALGRQLDFVAALVRNPRAYKEELKQALAAHPELQPAVDYFRELMDPTSADLRTRRTGSFLNKLLPFLADPTLLAACSAPQRGMDWAAVVRHGQTVLIDFRHELDPDRRRWKMLYWFRDFLDFVKGRGMAGRGQEVGLLIDEVTQLLGHRTLGGQAILADDLEELVAVLGRNFSVNVVISHQNLSQVEERIRNVLLQMGTQMIGVIKNPDDAADLTQALVRYRPFWVKKTTPVWMGISHPNMGYESTLQGDRRLVNYGSTTEPTVIDTTTQEYTLAEQQQLAAEQFMQLGRFEFLLWPALGEGQLTGPMQRISIANLDKNQYPEEAVLAPLRALLRQRDGVPLETLLAALRTQHTGEGGPKPKKAVKTPKEPATLKHHDVPADHLSDTAAPPDPSSRPGEDDEEELWQ